jgi:hypothetical protein
LQTIVLVGGRPGAVFVRALGEADRRKQNVRVTSFFQVAKTWSQTRRVDRILTKYGSSIAMWIIDRPVNLRLVIRAGKRQEGTARGDEEEEEEATKSAALTSTPPLCPREPHEHRLCR